MKDQWPELVGKPAEEARAAILRESVQLGLALMEVQVLPENSPVTRDYRPQRVRIFANAAGTVATEPRCAAAMCSSAQGTRSTMKDRWPELLGKPAEEARLTILRESAQLGVVLTVQVLPENSPVTLDYSPQRVRIFANAAGGVATEPRCG
eukprot:SM000243S08602  [mRNA]  locus=s243:113537:116004:- [translate_table: standard]